MCSSRAEAFFAVHVRNDNREGIPPLVRLKAVCAPGGQREPVITVMLPEEGSMHQGKHDGPALQSLPESVVR